jgi:predicted DNA-binding protein (MmcQ/YjbR family)
MALFDAISDFALSLPGAYMTEQWMGSHVFKISDDKMFCVLRPGRPNMLIKLGSLESRELLIEAGVAEIHTHMKRGNWADLLTDRLEKDDILARVEESYALVRFGLTKARQAALPPYPE